MTFFSMSGLLNGVSCFLLGIFVYLRDRRNLSYRTYFLFALSVGVWSFGYYFWPLAKDKLSALNSFRLLHFGAVFIPIFYYHFILAWTDQIKKRKPSLLIGYILAITIALFIPTKFYIQDMVPKFIFRFWAVPGVLYHFYLVYFFFYVIAAIHLIFKEMKRSQGIRRNQCKYVLWASIIGYLGGSTNYPLWYNIPVYPVVNILVTVYVGIIAYAILRHQLLEIEVIIKKSLVFAGMFIFAFGIFVTIALLVSQFIAGGNTLLAFAISAFIITLLLRPLETWLINVTDKFLFQKKYEYKQILKAFIDEVITVLNLDEVINSTLKLLDQALHPYAASIFILNKVEDEFQLYNAYGLEDKNPTFTSESKLVTFLKKTKDPAVIKQINGIVGVNPEIAAEMAKLKAMLVFPLMLHNDLIGFISLGKKKSDEEYTKDDLDVLQDLARTESIAVGNAQLLTEAAQAERRAAIGTMAAGIHHEIGNPLNIMSTKIQIFKLARQKGLLQNKSNEEILNEAETALDECLKQSGRISEITRKLSNFAKPSKEFKPLLISIPEEIEETLAVVGHDLELEKIKIDKKFSSDLTKILADRQEIQQIFFNLIRNAGQSIEGTGTITVSAVNTTNNKVHLEIQDTGKGIPEDKINRVFEPFFTTKGPNKGTGLGLTIVRQLVWRNKGEISFRSQVGTGTTFILEFPRGE